MKRFGVLLSLLTLAACQSSPTSPPINPTDPTSPTNPVDPTSPSNPATPTLTLTPASTNINAGDAPITFVATVQNSSETIYWVYEGTGSVTPTSGPVATYTPPSNVADVQNESLTAVLGATGVSTTAPIAVYPAEETPPSEPPPAPPPTEPTPPTDPTDATDPTDPTDPTNPDPPDPATTYTLTVIPPTKGKIISAEDGGVINCGNGASVCTAGYDSNAAEPVLEAKPDEGWEIDSWGDACSEWITSPVCELTMDADKTASVTFKLSDEPPAQTVAGTWEGIVTEGTQFTFILNLTQNQSEVTGDFIFFDTAYPGTGTFDGTKLEFRFSFGENGSRLLADVSGPDMSGTIDDGNGAGVANFTATRQNGN